MDRANVIKLISVETYKDSRGATRKRETERSIFARQVDSVTASEFFDGGRNGLNPSFRIIVFYADYKGETIVELNGDRYSIYRTYQNKSDELELYVERQGGVNG